MFSYIATIFSEIRRMNPHLLFFRTGHRLLEYRKHLKTRRIYCLISVATYTNSLLFCLLMFSAYDALLNSLFCISSTLIGISITALYLGRPLMMLPDVLYKVSMSTCALFYAIQSADAGKECSGYILAWVILANALQYYENYFLFNAIALIHREMEGLVQHRPPPTYELFAITAVQNKAPVQSKEDSASMSSAGPSSSFDPTVPRPQTPPPTYDVALKIMEETGTQPAIVPQCSCFHNTQCRPQ